MDKMEYLGDGVYASFDGYQIWLTAEGSRVIAIEPAVMDRLLRYADRVFKRNEQPPEQS